MDTRVSNARKNRDVMTDARWARIKSLPANTARYFHTSCRAGMRGDPRGIGYPAIPYVEKPGTTYNVGRNMAKRERKALAKSWVGA